MIEGERKHFESLLDDDRTCRLTIQRGNSFAVGRPQCNSTLFGGGGGGTVGRLFWPTLLLISRTRAD